MKFEEYRQHDATGLAELIKTKEVTAEEVNQTAIEGIEAINPRINAITFTDFDQSLLRSQRQSQNSDLTKPFAGVPFLIKDALSAVKGWPLTYSCKGLKNNISSYDSSLTTRFREAGLNFLGRTNTPEFALYGITEPALFGPTNNPWDLSRNAGGSSGGSAAAVAAGIVPMASASDGGGSIRIPSSCCGVFGLKPSRGRVATGPDFGEVWNGASSDHVLTRSVRDSALMLDLIQGPDFSSSYCAPPPSTPYHKAIKTPPKSLRIAMQTHSPLGSKVHNECIKAVENTAKQLESLGHNVEIKTPDYSGEALLDDFFTVYFTQAALAIESIGKHLGRNTKVSDVESSTWVMGLIGKSYRADEVLAARQRWHDYSRIMGEFHRSYDLLMMPSIADLPAKNGAHELSPVEKLFLPVVNHLRLGRLTRLVGAIDDMKEKHISKVPFTQLANVTGQPAMSVPTHTSACGLPVGVQFIAPYGDEETLFKLAAQLEEINGWGKNFPNLI